jgi:NADH-quinone oxidoreductase subunit L
VLVGVSSAALVAPLAAHPVLAATGAGAAPTTAATGALTASWLLVALPLASAGLLLVLGRRADRWGHWLGVLACGASFVVGAVVFVALLGRPPEQRVADLFLFTWVPAGGLEIPAGLRIDPLSVAFVLLVTFVGTLIHVYSVAYMAHDADRRRFFAYLNLFVAAMLLLVLADSYALLFVGWEGVGLASYLLIGFWNHNTPYAVAAKKAFVMNRVGDVGLLVAMMAMAAAFGVLDFDGVFAAVDGASQGLLTLIGLALLVAACGKSAQFPLQAWLGDAMAGPTPVSALIHAATMVTAGVYLVVRSAPIYDGAPTAQLVVVLVGAVTLVFGAVVGAAKDDIKKVLAASTMSQIGYMVLAAGLGPVGYAFAIFHLLTHGFFKAGMFLGAGSVMHGMQDQVDMRRYGGLSTLMRITWVTFGISWLAILGVPPFSGFFSKDKIIEAAFVPPADGWAGQPWVIGTVAVLGAGLTAFYMSRLFFMTFHGARRWSAGQHPHESPPLMTVPMVVLAVGAATLGLVLGRDDALSSWLAPVLGEPEHAEPVVPVPVIVAATLLLVALGALLAWRQYALAPVPEVAPTASAVTRAARRDLYQDEVNEGLFMRPGQYLTRTLVYVDSAVVDAAAVGTAGAIPRAGERLRRLQNGFVRSYAAMMLLGVLVVVGVVALARA